MKSKIYRSILGWLLTIILLISVMPVSFVYAEEENAQESEEELQETEELILIHNVQELQELAQNCKVDAWSAGVRVKLCENISLEGIDFEPIPYFSGTFDGDGHTISGFSLSGEGYADGFFRYVGENAVIQNLKISGVIESDHEKECVGGICGINRGTIVDCKFVGVVKGQSAVGGIAGENESSGIIRNCYSYGSINGEDGVGGIVGKNHGSVMGCDNKAGINNDRAGVEERDSEGLEWILDAAQTDDIRLRSNMDIGGIAGYSDGFITYCSNSGVVGYEHIGYNIGGIVGRQSGFLNSCTNTGEVYGRKDVGGIVGQMEPFISVDEAESISVAVQTLHDQINQLLDDMDQTQSVLSSDFDELKVHSDSALDHGESISDRLVDFTDENIGSVNSIAANIGYVIDRLPDILDRAHQALNGMSNVSDDMQQLNEDLDVTDKLHNSDYNETEHKRLSTVTGVGGNLTVDQTNPDQGTVVTITSNAENGYRLKTLKITEASGTEIPYTQSVENRNKYTFIMPQGNVVVKGEYEYTGAYIASSNAGGNLSVSASDQAQTVKISVVPDGGYRFDGVYVGSEYYEKSRFTAEDSIYTMEITRQEPGVPIIVSTTFIKDDDSHKITSASSTGGYLSVDKVNAASGETVTVTVHEDTDYKLTSIKMNGTALSGASTANKYTFQMPGTDAEVLAEFTYQPDGDTEVYTESEIGGTVSAVKNLGSNNYSIVITPGSGYQVKENALIITGSGESSVTVNRADLTQSGNGYTYTLNKNYYTNPIRVYGCFEKIPDTHTVRVTDGTGGMASANKANADAGETVTVTAKPASGYRLSSLIIRSAGSDVSYNRKSAEDTYEFIMPDADAEIIAEFEPVQLIVVSNAGGKASCSVDGTNVTLTVSPDTGYTLSGHPVVTDRNGNSLPVSRKNAGSYRYVFTVDETMEPVKIAITFAVSSDYDSVQDARDRINVNTEILKDSMERASDTVAQIESLTQDEYGNAIPVEDFLNDSEKTDQLVNLLLDLTEEMTDALEAASAIVSDLNTIANILAPYMEDASNQANEDIDAALDDLGKIIEELKKASNDVQEIIDYLGAQEDIRMSELGGDFSLDVDGLFEDLENISGCMSRIGDDIENYSGIISDDLRAINDQMNKIFHLLVDKMDDAENMYMEEENYDDISGQDISDEEIEETTNGKVENCSNTGKVEGDLNVGGIAGSMAIDEEDPEDNAAGKVERSLGNKYLTKCVMIGCVNNGNILAKKDGVGCIAGYMDLGVIMNCEAYGTAKSTEGEYVGGICGQSFGLIRNSYSLCTLKGSRYVGGIAGYGYKIQNCYSMTLIDGASERTGAIAGRIYVDEENERTIDREFVSDNYYVSSTLNGIDDISYIGIAEPLTYEELLETVGLPYAYRHLKISFVVDGITIQRTEAAYGESLSDIEYPVIPATDGCFGTWVTVPYERMEGNITIEAEYHDNITTLKSIEGVTSSGENTESEKPFALADGIFDGNAVLHAYESDMMVPEEVTGHNDYIVYEISLEGIQTDGTQNEAKQSGETQETRVRLYHEFGGDVKVYQYVDGSWIETEAKEYGSYQQVLMQGTQGIFCIVSDNSSKLWIMMLAGGAVSVVIIVVLIKSIHKRRKRKKLRSQEE